jgi:hypothetical protein
VSLRHPHHADGVGLDPDVGRLQIRREACRVDETLPTRMATGRAPASITQCDEGERDLVAVFVR